MANVFTISTPTQTLKADANGTATTVFTVTNTHSRPLRGIAKIKALGSTQGEWLKIDGETERDFAAGGTHQFTAAFNKPKPVPPPTATQPAQSFPFRVDVISAINPDEDFTEGPVVTVEIAELKVEPPKPPVKWWWWLIIGLGILLVVGLIVGLLASRGCCGVKMSEREPGKNRQGSDFGILVNTNVQICENACRDIPNCQSYTFVNSSNQCLFKNTKPTPVENADTISGVKVGE
ncbi:MAG TPA: PAN domain-containing protein [Pyrinomonadaceae bacterium]|jgi:hypothetical protein